MLNEQEAMSLSTPGRVDWDKVRSLFHVTQERVYLATAAYGPGPTTVVEATKNAIDQWAGGGFDWQEWEAEAEKARTAFARIIQAEAEEIALLPSVSLAAAQVARGLSWNEGDNLVIGASHFRSNLFPWMQLKERGVEIRYVEPRNGCHFASDFELQTDHHTRLIVCSSVQSTNGHRIDLEALLQTADQHSSLTFVDATQQVGSLVFDAKKFDFVAVSGYKWLLNPRGTAYLYVKREHIERMEPIAPGWKSHPQPYSNYYGGPLDHDDTARRFDQSLAWPLWVGSARALDFILEVGTAEIEERNLALSSALCEALELPKTGSSIVGVRVSDPTAVAAGLAEQGVVASLRSEFVRLAFHLFNNFEEVEMVSKLLKTHRVCF